MVRDLEIIEYTADYATALVTLSRRLETDPMPCSYWGLDERDATALLDDPHQWTGLAIIESHVAGIATLRRGQQYRAHLAELSVAVCPQHRRKGIAQSLVQHLEATAMEQGIDLLKALIWEHNLPSRRLFETLGFEHRATLYAEFKSPRFGEINDCVYYKRLTVPAPAQ